MNIIKIKDVIFVYWNANGLKSKRYTLVEFLLRNKIGIAYITETHLKDSETFKITGYKIYRNDRKYTHSSGVAILIKNKPKHNPIILPSTLQIETIAKMLQQINTTYALYLHTTRRIRKFKNQTYSSNLIIPPPYS